MCAIVACVGLLMFGIRPAMSATTVEDNVRALAAENSELKALLRAQQQQLDAFSAKISALMEASDRREAELAELRKSVAAASSSRAPAPAAPAAEFEREEVAPRQKISEHLLISGEAGVAFFAGQSDSAYPNNEFRVDDAKLFVEAELARNIYLFSGIDVTLREANDEYAHLGESYLEFAELPSPFGERSALTLRAGRIQIPFGEEYQVRGIADNPLVTHSAADIWGIDEGLEIFGDAGKFSYALALQNGGHKTLHDFNRDKSVIARIGFDPARWLHLSASAMRTGDLSRADDGMSEVWFGGGFFRALGPGATTTTFHSSLAQVDAIARWRGGYASGTIGRVWFDDDDLAADNRRTIDHWKLEGVQTLVGKFYGAARYSRIASDKGYPLVGLANFGAYFFNEPATARLWRLSLGVGYHLTPDLLLKVEYAFEGGRLVNGEARDEEDLFSAAAGVKF